MHLANDLVISPPVYEPIWKRPRSEGRTSTGTGPVVHIAAERDLREEIEAQLLNQGVEVNESPAATNMACRQDPHRPACSVIDVDTQNEDVSSLLSAIAGRDNPPVILIGRCNDSRVLVRAMKLGAFDYLAKPLNVRELVNAILSAMEQDRRQAPKRVEERVLRDRMASLTPREREVLPLVVGGLLNKQAASLLGISEITLQIHRGQVMRKMQADSLADLVRMCVKLRIRHWRPAA
jgi:FixJ family two-component response regulator